MIIRLSLLYFRKDDKNKCNFFFTQEELVDSYKDLFIQDISVDHILLFLPCIKNKKD